MSVVERCSLARFVGRRRSDSADETGPDCDAASALNAARSGPINRSAAAAAAAAAEKETNKKTCADPRGSRKYGGEVLRNEAGDVLFMATPAPGRPTIDDLTSR